jgi:hypothetical protein
MKGGAFKPCMLKKSTSSYAYIQSLRARGIKISSIISLDISQLNNKNHNINNNNSIYNNNLENKKAVMKM